MKVSKKLLALLLAVAMVFTLAIPAFAENTENPYLQVFAKSEVSLNGATAPNGNRDSETNMGDLVTDAMLWQAMQGEEKLLVDSDRVVAVTNGNGIRASIGAGDVTVADVYGVLPEDNTVTVIYVKGSALLEALEASTYCLPEAIGAFPQMAGIDCTVLCCAEYVADEAYPDSAYFHPASINRVTVNSVNGKAFDENATYAVVTNSACAAGKDTYTAFGTASSKVDTGVTVADALIGYITESLNGVVGQQYAKPQGRITVLAHDWSDWEALIPGCVTNKDLFADDDGNIAGCDVRVCKACGEVETVDTPATPGDHSKDPFTDIAGSGYHDYIVAGGILGIANGFENGTFQPKTNVTRAQFVTMLWRMAGEPEAKDKNLKFADASQVAEPFRAAVAWGAETGIVGGYGDKTFRPRQDVSRAQMATFIYRFICMLAESEAPAELLTPVGYADEGYVANPYKDAVNCISNMGIMNGTGNNMFSPNGTANRGMAVTVLVRLYVLAFEAA